MAFSVTWSVDSQRPQAKAGWVGSPGVLEQMAQEYVFSTGIEFAVLSPLHS